MCLMADASLTFMALAVLRLQKNPKKFVDKKIILIFAVLKQFNPVGQERRARLMLMIV